MFPAAHLTAADRLVGDLRRRRLMIATAESCTGGLIAALLTELPGSSDVFERGFVTYSNAAKCDLLAVPATLIGRFGAVSAEVAVAMVAGALRTSVADIAVAVTGIAGPGGGSRDKPVGLVYVCAQMRHSRPVVTELRLGDIGRSAVREATVLAALNLVDQLLATADGEAGTP